MLVLSIHPQEIHWSLKLRACQAARLRKFAPSPCVLHETLRPSQADYSHARGVIFGALAMTQNFAGQLSHELLFQRPSQIQAGFRERRSECFLFLFWCEGVAVLKQDAICVAGLKEVSHLRDQAVSRCCGGMVLAASLTRMLAQRWSMGGMQETSRIVQYQLFSC